MKLHELLGPDFPRLFANIEAPQAIECGGCAPPVIVETERQRDQRIADELRALNRARADGASK